MNTETSTMLLAARWAKEWPHALAAWSSYTQLRSPNFINDQNEAKREGMMGELAAIRLQDQRIVVNLATIRERGLEDNARAILAHEIGHHVYVPGNLTDNARMLAAMAGMLSGLPVRVVHVVANLYGDLLINDRLQRRAGIDIAAVYRKLVDEHSSHGEVWKLYMRTYEHLWLLPPGSLVRQEITPDEDADAMLIARLIRNFAGDWLRGARRFAAILYPYLVKDEAANRQPALAELGLHDTKSAGSPVPGQNVTDAIPDGLTGIDPSELEDENDDFDGDILDPLGEQKARTAPPLNQAPSREGKGKPGSQYRQPFEYRQLLKALGLDVSQNEMTVRYYRERALPHLIPFPTKHAPQVKEPLAEGYSEWEVGDPLEELDAVGSLLRSPWLVPGITTVQRVYGDSPGNEPARVPLDLDIYVDSSGSMPHPSVDVSYLALAGTILAMSALRAGARVQATLWSGTRQFQSSNGFSRDERTILSIVTGRLGGATAFPLHILRDTYLPSARSKPSHVVVISDDGADTMLQNDERGTPGATICAEALKRAGGGGTLVLNLFRQDWPAQEKLESLGFAVHRVTRWEELVSFARAFVRRTYGTNT
jgi:hypothetical protein